MNPKHHEWLAIERGHELRRDAAGSQLMARAPGTPRPNVAQVCWRADSVKASASAVARRSSRGSDRRPRPRAADDTPRPRRASLPLGAGSVPAHCRLSVGSVPAQRAAGSIDGRAIHVACPRRDLGPARRAEFRQENVLHVRARGFRCDAERVGDLAVGQALRDQPRDLELAGRSVVATARRPRCGHGPGGGVRPRGPAGSGSASGWPPRGPRPMATVGGEPGLAVDVGGPRGPVAPPARPPTGARAAPSRRRPPRATSGRSPSSPWPAPAQPRAVVEGGSPERWCGGKMRGTAREPAFRLTGSTGGQVDARTPVTTNMASRARSPTIRRARAPPRSGSTAFPGRPVSNAGPRRGPMTAGAAIRSSRSGRRSAVPRRASHAHGRTRHARTRCTRAPSAAMFGARQTAPICPSPARPREIAASHRPAAHSVSVLQRRHDVGGAVRLLDGVRIGQSLGEAGLPPDRRPSRASARTAVSRKAVTPALLSTVSAAPRRRCVPTRREAAIWIAGEDVRPWQGAQRRPLPRQVTPAAFESLQQRGLSCGLRSARSRRPRSP